ncbi:hypothetical protein K3G39_14475 [Pontibacter sp. HSC-14F20]|uniref:hypothetical protein n=1 Tax=Pontibacter sp. HSC-14F20 TaxID=2864136 RepID=UPI001C73000F|nr:hypothetical protein [Pontibacter sp. HSC-14F20]MBX0334444.1 hypothetical protein [Pontibacter sp. HSC-14F20]
MNNFQHYEPQSGRKRYVLRTLLCLGLGIAGIGTVSAQSSQDNEAVKSLQKHRQASLQEKLYLHIDRPVYACGDEMWFKVYNVDGSLHRPLDMSKVTYVELLDADQKPALQAKVAMKDGTGSGYFQLPTILRTGNYTVRAYTSWMKNFDPEFYFQQQVTIINTFEQLPKQEAPKAKGYTLQFFPEGGNLLAGIASQVAFKVTESQSGKGTALTGEVHDQEGNAVAALTPHKYGMGRFAFTPAQGKRYTAKLKLPDGSTQEQALPQVYERGYTLQLADSTDQYLYIAVRSVGKPDEQVYLLGHTRQQIVSSEKSLLQNGKGLFRVSKSDLADGITHFTVFNTAGQPVSERLYFKYPTKELALQVVAPQQQFNLRDKVSLALQASSQTPANLSMAVYKLDSLQQQPQANINSYIWLESDLKGTIENPAYYFSDTGRADRQAVDNLMLTNGWSRFKWEDVLEKDAPQHAYLSENHGHLLLGKVTQKSSGQPAPGIMTYLASPGRPIRFYNAQSNADGKLLFELKDYYGNKDLVLQSDFTKDSTYHFELLSPFSSRYTSGPLSMLQLTESRAGDIADRHMQVQVEHAYFGAYRNRQLAPGIDSSAFYGQPSESYLLDDYKRFKVMEEVMREYVQGVQVRLRGRSFNLMVMNRPYKSIFRENPMVLLDGVPVFNIDKIMAFDPLKVKQLDVVTSRFFHGPMAYEGLVSYHTYGGDLAGFDLDARALMQAYEGLQQKREFYAPTYDTPEQKRSRLADFRNLLHWTPEIKLNPGKDEQVSFYTSDQPGTYLVVVQGLSASGEAGYQVLQIKVNGPVAQRQ